MPDNNLEVNMYEFNKVNMAQIEPLDPIWLNKKCIEVANRLIKENFSFWMLLCRERNDYTIFYNANGDIKKLEKSLKECLNNRGFIIDFTDKENGNYEIWIRDFDTKENFVYYLFDYNTGIIEV